MYNGGRGVVTLAARFDKVFILSLLGKGKGPAKEGKGYKGHFWEREYVDDIVLR